VGNRAVDAGSDDHAWIELDAERERTVELKAGVPRANDEIQLDARDDPKRKQTT
jgi:membrane protein